MRTAAICIGTIAMVLAGPMASQAVGASAGAPDFSGTWQIDERRSEDPLDKMKEAIAQQRVEAAGGSAGGARSGGKGAGGGGRSGGGGRGGGRGGRSSSGSPDSGERRSGSQDGAIESRLAVLIEGADYLSVAHEEPLMSLVYSTGETRDLYTDGRKVQTDAEGGDLTTTSKWDNEGRLVVKTKSERGNVIETFWLEEGGVRLFVTTKLKAVDGLPSITFIRTYDPVSGDEIRSDVE